MTLENFTLCLGALALLCWLRVGFLNWKLQRNAKVYEWRAGKLHSHHTWVPVGLNAKGHMKCGWTKPDDNQIE